MTHYLRDFNLKLLFFFPRTGTCAFFKAENDNPATFSEAFEAFLTNRSHIDSQAVFLSRGLVEKESRLVSIF